MVHHGVTIHIAMAGVATIHGAILGMTLGTILGIAMTHGIATTLGIGMTLGIMVVGDGTTHATMVDIGVDTMVATMGATGMVTMMVAAIAGMMIITPCHILGMDEAQAIIAPHVAQLLAKGYVQEALTTKFMAVH